jgi:GMP reductase
MIRKGLDFNDVLIVPKASSIKSRNDVNLWTYINGFIIVLPICSSNVDNIGTFEMALALAHYGMPTFLQKSYTAKEIINHFKLNPTQADMSIPTVGLDNMWDFAKTVFINAPIRILNIDGANGYTRVYKEAVLSFKTKYPNLVIIAGNVCTADGAHDLFESGADFVRVGIGNGSLCTTRIKTGVGTPQVTALMECANIADKMSSPYKKYGIICDGGCTCPGDIVKAFVAGADMVMIGGMFAGCKEGGGEIIKEIINSLSFRPFSTLGPPPIIKETIKVYGMASAEAIKKYNKDHDYRTSEGREIEIPYRGSVEPIVKDILGGVRSACSYLNCSSISQLKFQDFITTSNQYNQMLLGE